MKPCIWLLLLMLPTQLFALRIKRLDGSRITQNQLNHWVDSLCRQHKITGAHVQLYQRNQLAYQHNVGYANQANGLLMTDTSLLYAASFSKTAFAYFVLHCLQEGVVALDTPLVRYLSEPLPSYQPTVKRRNYADLAADKRYEQITARMCLAHTTGLPNWRWFEPDKKLKIKFAPGSRYSYSGEGLQLLQFVLEQRLGKNYELLMREKIFDPLGMHHSSQLWQDGWAKGNVARGHDEAGKPYELDKRTYAGGAGSLCTTPADWAKFYTAFLNHKGLAKRWWREMNTPQIRIRQLAQFGPLSWRDSTLNDDIALSYGLGLGLFETPYGRAIFKEGHDDGWNHHSLAFPAKGMAIVIFTNSDHGDKLFRPLLQLAMGDTRTPFAWEGYR